MGDSIPAYIKVGGDVPADVFLGLAAAFECQGVAFEWGDAHMTFSQVVDEARTGFPSGEGFLIGRDDQANYGNFNDIESYCAEHGLSYDKHSDAKYEHDAMSEFRRGKEIIEINSTQDGLLMTNLDPLRELVAAWRKLGQRTISLATVVGRLTKILPAEVPPLPLLMIVGDLDKALAEREARDE